MAMTVTFEYDVDIKPRYWPQPHGGLFAILDRRRDVYAGHLRTFSGLADTLASISQDPTAPREPYWGNPFFSGLDAIALVGMLATIDPRRYIEIGSGNSTKFARWSARTFGLRTTITSVDREPRAEIDDICDEVVRTPLEQMDLAIFDRLEDGDILFVDGSHQVLSNSDTTVVFLDVLPRLKPGVWVHVHDVFLPWDYPADWNNRYYAEQYLLACWLLADSPRVDVELPVHFVWRDAALLGLLTPIHQRLPDVAQGGGSFWMRRR
jgi:hypothetical protein